VNVTKKKHWSSINRVEWETNCTLAFQIFLSYAILRHWSPICVEAQDTDIPVLWTHITGSFSPLFASPLISRQTSILYHVHNPILYMSYVSILKTFHSTVHSSYSPFLVHTGKLFKSTSYCKRHYSFYTSRLIFKDFSILKTTFCNTEYNMVRIILNIQLIAQCFIIKIH